MMTVEYMNTDPGGALLAAAICCICYNGPIPVDIQESVYTLPVDVRLREILRGLCVCTCVCLRERHKEMVCPLIGKETERLLSGTSPPIGLSQRLENMCGMFIVSVTSRLGCLAYPGKRIPH